MDYEFSRLEQLEPEGGSTWPLLSLGGLIVLVFAAASIYLIQTSMWLQQSIQLKAGWMLSLDGAQGRLFDDSEGKNIEDARERLRFEKNTVGQLLQVRSDIMQTDPRKVMVARLDRLYQGLSQYNALLTESSTWDGSQSLRKDIQVEVQGIMEDLRRTSTHETIDLGSKWFLLNGLASQSIILAGLTLFLVRTTVLRGRKLQVALDWVKRIATKDELTGLWNRRAIFPILNRELARCERESKPVSVLMVDFDHFKKINDQYGHKAGDAVLREGAQRMLGILRPYDSIGRYGGEEIIILLPGCDRDESRAVGERLAGTVRDAPFIYNGQKIPATVSIGGATKRSPTPTHADRMVVSADQYLYEAKSTGRDRVVTGPSLSYDGEVSETGS